MGSDKVVVLFVEGETEKEFYDAVIKRLREINGGRLDCYVNVQVLKGIGNFKKKAERILLKGIMKNEKYKNLSAHVVLCYDTDVFDRDKNRVKINWKGIEKGLKENGAASVSHVKAVKSIEDWFLIDKSGIKISLGCQNLQAYRTSEDLRDCRNYSQPMVKVISKARDAKVL